MIYHVVEQHGAAGDRVKRARNSWDRIYSKGVKPWHRSAFLFTSGAMGDSRRLPLLTEILHMESPLAATDIIMLTNDDTVLHPELPALLEKKLARQGAVSSFRLNVTNAVSSILTAKPASLAKAYYCDYGRDLFAFTGAWLEEHRASLPMMFLGEFEWDIVMAVLIRDSLGMTPKATKELWWKSEAELPLGYVFHERHPTLWKTAAFAKNPAKEWNRVIARAWYRDHNLEHLCTV